MSLFSGLGSASFKEHNPLQTIVEDLKAYSLKGAHLLTTSARGR